MLSISIFAIAAMTIVGVQSFNTSDTHCEGVIWRVIHGEPAKGPDGVCWHGDSVRLRMSIGIASLAVAGVTATVIATSRSNRRRPR